MSISPSPVTDVMTPLYAQHSEIHRMLTAIRLAAPADFDNRPEYMSLSAAANSVSVALDCLRTVARLS